jgi:RND family efflux transporter MFP subunit
MRTSSTDTAPPLRQLLLVLIVLGASAAVTAMLVLSRDRAVSEPPEVVVPTVEVMTVRASDVPITIESTGRLQPVARLDLSSQLAARVTALGDDFESGAEVRAGDLLVELERSDFELAVARAEAALAEVRAALELEEAQAETSVSEWKLIGKGEPSALVRREPQLAQARARVGTAEVQLEQANTNLARTRITAPFDGRITARRIELGQYAAPGQVMGTLVGVDEWEVRLAVSGADQPYLAAARPYDPERAPDVWLGLDGDDGPTLGAQVVRTSPEVDPRTQTLEIYARVQLDEGTRPSAGRFVQALIEGRVIEGAIVLPRSALRGGDEVLVIGAASRVFRRPVHVARRDSNSVVITGGLQPGERVVVSSLPISADGMEVRVLDGQALEISAPSSARTLEENAE